MLKLSLLVYGENFTIELLMMKKGSFYTFELFSVQDGLDWMDPRGRGGREGKGWYSSKFFSWGVRFGSLNPDPILDQNIQLAGTPFQTYPLSSMVSRIHTHFCKIQTHFQTYRPKWLKSIPYLRPKRLKETYPLPPQMPI